MRIVICDDEPLARQRLSRLLGQIDNCHCVGEAESGDDLLELVHELMPDVVLLDIRMPQMDGMTVAARLGNLARPPAIIFCTAYDEHALAAFRVQALDYLLKPIGLKALRRALDRVTETPREQSSEPQQRQFITAQTHRGLERVAVSEVRCFVAADRYVLARHSEGELLIDATLRELEQELSGQFVRVHRNALVALEYIEMLKSTMTGYHVTMQGIDETLKVSRRHAAGLRQLLKSL